MFQLCIVPIWAFLHSLGIRGGSLFQDYAIINFGDSSTKGNSCICDDDMDQHSSEADASSVYNMLEDFGGLPVI